MDFFLNNEVSESCLFCIWNTCWSSSSSLPNMKAIHWMIKVTYNFEKRLTWDDAWCPTPARPDNAVLTDGFFERKKKRPKIEYDKHDMEFGIWVTFQRVFIIIIIVIIVYSYLPFLFIYSL